MRQAIIDLGAKREAGAQPGLILHRFLGRHDDPDERRALLYATRCAALSGSLQSIYSEAYSRWVASFSQDAACRSERLATAGRLIVGLGAENVLEAGLRLHHTYGIPIIPGSTLKGLASHYCHDVWGQRQDRNAPEENTAFRRGGRCHSLLFGTTEDGGVITFHDAWITPESLSAGALRLDVMTPHHPDWQTPDAPPPTDFDSPVPVSFLSVVGTFDVRLSWSGPAAASPELAKKWTALAMTLLREALAEWGVGGKTSSGYGRLAAVGSLPGAGQPSSADSASAPKQVTPPKANERIEAVLLEERTKKGGWKALHRPSGLTGDIQNSAAVPPDKKAGDMLELFVAFATERAIAFIYPTPQEEARRASSTRRSGPQRGSNRRR